MSSFYPINITSIRIIKTRDNFETYIKAITALDCVISDNLNHDNKILSTSKYGLIIDHLFDYIAPDSSMDNTRNKNINNAISVHSSSLS